MPRVPSPAANRIEICPSVQELTVSKLPRVLLNRRNSEFGRVAIHRSCLRASPQ